MSALNSSAGDAYVVRWFEDGDVSDFLALDRAVFQRERDERWFEWKYEDNPYVDHVPILVVENEDDIVGARPFIAFRLRAGAETVLALQPADTMVHPEHRRRGLFTRMTERAIDHYANREPAFFFNFPNQRSRPGYLKLGWQIVGDRVTYYRIQNPAAFFGGDGRIPSRLAELAVQLTGDVREFRRTPADAAGEFSVDRYPGTRASILAELYETRPPDGFHALRDETFYRWRFASPAWSRATYVASQGGQPVAGIVVRNRTTAEGVSVTQLADVVPLAETERRTRALARLVERIVADHASSDILAVAEGGVPRRLLTEFGFVGDATPPLSWMSDFDCRLVALPLGGTGWTVGGERLSHRSNWHVSFAERDTA
ncbi:GNAT family N-acetyltransferase [Haladaptatus salinisoli]|uniref:GNAT family N-acetyltransferase n=1 Tax=Haladaptatus salinisoli TaxID=2884876 RepID=UPI001D0B3E5C|nr:GNAT family N-acetyltransferase [Haladaptatus salinisoli]